MRRILRAPLGASQAMLRAGGAAHCRRQLQVFLRSGVTGNGELTDVSGDFDIVEKDGGSVVRRVIIHAA